MLGSALIFSLSGVSLELMLGSALMSRSEPPAPKPSVGQSVEIGTAMTTDGGTVVRVSPYARRSATRQRGTAHVAGHKDLRHSAKMRAASPYGDANLARWCRSSRDLSSRASLSLSGVSLECAGGQR